MPEIKQKSIKMPAELVDKVEKEAKENHRNFTTQVIHILTKYYELKES